MQSVESGHDAHPDMALNGPSRHPLPRGNSVTFGLERTLAGFYKHTA